MDIQQILEQLAQNSCKSTTAGFIWHCDEHDTHGNADFLMEAHASAYAHVHWMMQYTDQDEECEYVIVEGKKK